MLLIFYEQLLHHCLNTFWLSSVYFWSSNWPHFNCFGVASPIFYNTANDVPRPKIVEFCLKLMFGLVNNCFSFFFCCYFSWIRYSRILLYSFCSRQFASIFFRQIRDPWIASWIFQLNTPLKMLAALVTSVLCTFMWTTKNSQSSSIWRRCWQTIYSL